MINYTDFADRIVRDVARKVPAFEHLDPDRIAVVGASRWAGNAAGTLAYCNGLQREDKPVFSIWVQKGTRNVIQVSPWFQRRTVEVVFKGERSRYLISLHLPRLLRHNPLETLVHELYHINEKFDGTLRKARHGSAFDRQVGKLMDDYLSRAKPDLAELATMKIGRLQERFGSVMARTLPRNFRAGRVEKTEPPCSYEEGIERIYPGYRLASSYRIKEMKFDSPTVPKRITEVDCGLRVYHAAGALTLPASCGRYARPVAASS